MARTLTAYANSRADLSDAQVEDLLSRATLRLTAKHEAPEPVRKQDPLLKMPRLRVHEHQSALVTNNEVSIINSVQPAYVDSVSIRKVEDPVAAKRIAKENKGATAGAAWFDLPKTHLTPELKRDLQLLKMRNVLDPHRHYKKENGRMQVPEYSQVGTIVEGATEFYSSRIENRKRKRTFVEEVLAGEQETGRFKRKYGEVQAKKGSGKKAFYSSLKMKRKNGVKKGG